MTIETSTFNAILSLGATSIIAYNIWLIRKVYEISEKLSTLAALVDGCRLHTISTRREKGHADSFDP